MKRAQPPKRHDASGLPSGDVRLNLAHEGTGPKFSSKKRYQFRPIIPATSSSLLDEADLKKGTLKIGGIGSTRKGGPPELMKQEGKYFKQLQSMVRFEIVDKNLVLTDEKKKYSLLFRASGE